MNRVTHFVNDFSKQCETYKFKNGLELPIFEIYSYHTLSQFVGYAKYLNREIGNVYLRGQHKLYDTLLPSIFRRTNSNSGFSNRCKHISEFLSICSQKMQFIKDLDDYAKEPLIQHYGIHTRWIDLVDNLWIAIWFGIHDWHTRLYDREYKNIVRRKGGKDEYMYLLLVCSDGILEQKNCPGLYKGQNTFTIDLRKACPSTFLRPHSQHALLMRTKKMDTLADVEMASSIVGIIRLKVDDCFDWIGDNGLVSARSLFPPANFDHGYGVLIEQTPHSKVTIRDYGSIYSVTY
ncbi:MAG: FRG domain-containing protein [Spirosomataceae bacterium]